MVAAAQRAGISCKQTYANEGKILRRRAGGYTHAKQFKRLRKTINRQPTIPGVVMPEVQRKLDANQQDRSWHQLILQTSDFWTLDWYADWGQVNRGGLIAPMHQCGTGRRYLQDCGDAQLGESVQGEPNWNWAAQPVPH